MLLCVDVCVFLCLGLALFGACCALAVVRWLLLGDVCGVLLCGVCSVLRCLSRVVCWLPCAMCCFFFVVRSVLLFGVCLMSFVVWCLLAVVRCLVSVVGCLI